MSSRIRLSVRPFAALLIGTLAAIACSDASVTEARSNREAVDAEASAYAELLRGGTGADSIPTLEAIATRLDAVARDGDPAANLLLARVRLDLGRLRLDAATAEESAIAARRSAAMTTLAAAASFAAGAEELRGVEFEAQRRGLEAARAAAEGDRSSSQSLLREIDQRTRVREVEISRLERSVRAAEEQATGYRELAAREDVVGARATAGRFRVSIADERSRLVADANSTPRHTRAAGDLAIAAAEADGSSRGIETLASIDASIRRQAESLADTAAALRAPIAAAATPAAAEPLLGGDRIAAELDAARRDYAAAASAAGRAASGGDRSLQSSARALQLNARFGELATDLVDAERLASEAGLKAALGEAASEIEELRTAAETIRTRIEEQLATLEGSIESMGGSGPAAAMMRAEFAAAVQRLSGASSEAAAAPIGAANPAAATATAADGPPFTSVEDLAAFIASGAISNAPANVQRQVLLATSRGAKRLLEVNLAMARTGDDVRVAMIDTFGTAANAGPGGFGAFEGGEVLSSSGDEAEFGSGTSAVRLVRRDGRWFIDFDAMLASMGMGDPAAMGATAEMLEAASSQMGPFFRMFAQRIRNGEFSSADEANMAMAEAMAQAMIQMAGQAGGQATGRR
jgi:hypothetical protein